jgi:DNA-binding response OmpR family regulator
MTAPLEKILLVDDNRKYLENLAKFLRSEGYHVDEAHDGDEAAQRLTQQEYDLVVSDLVMPGFNGFHLLEKKRFLAPDVPTLIMSSFADINLRELIEAGAVDFIAKPLALDDLLNKVRKTLDTRSERGAQE